MLRTDGRRAYPVVGGVPVLIAPEALAPKGDVEQFDLSAPQYAEAYEEMAYYNRIARERAACVEASPQATLLGRARAAPESERKSFPEPRSTWIDTLFDAAAQFDAYCHLASLAAGGSVLQLGGAGLHAVKFLLAGADEALLLSPMIGELEFARELARHFGVAARLRLVSGVGEEIPLADSALDAVYCGGCLHHMETDRAFGEIARILRPGGRFAAVEPWRAPLYRLGTRVFGKREPVHCRPLTAERCASLTTYFTAGRLIHHGALSRYAMIGFSRIGLTFPRSLVETLTRADDRLSSVIPRVRDAGSSVAVLAIK